MAGGYPSIRTYTSLCVVREQLFGTAYVLQSSGCMSRSDLGSLRPHSFRLVSSSCSICVLEKGLRSEDLIHQSRNCICTDPRDKIYALLSLPHKPDSIRIEPDYTKNVYELYQDAVSSIIGSSRQLRVLTAVELHEDLERVPS